ncbi:hypothetical protein [Rhodanobacter sp. B05]|uniref:hypothetical protein n=1 Tax=Rhodanobacter sp. B05 TaxID=1945859 RepID=UPI0011156DED|nr:hypothetical protein [Rhodanobacter sp. B05]
MNKAYTAAVNRLVAHSGRTVTVSVDGKKFEANAGKVANALIGAKILTSNANGPADAKGTEDSRASTYGGGFDSRNGVLDYQPQTTIYRNAIEYDRARKSLSISADLSRTFIHEGIHMLPDETVLYNLYYNHPAKYMHDHQHSFNNASSQLFDDHK